MKRLLRFFIKISLHPVTNLITGMLLLGAGINEAMETVAEDWQNTEVKVHHGIIVFSIVHILKFLPEVFEGFQEIGEASESEEE